MAFARENNLPEVTYRAHESGVRNFKIQGAKTYAQALGVTWEWLMFGDQRGLDAAAQAARPQSASGIMPTLQVPAYDLSAAAGSGRAILDDAPTSYVAFPADWARAFTGPTGDAQALALMTVAGDSMTPTLAHGDQILGHLSPSPSGLDGIYVLRFADDLLVKRLQLHPANGSVALISDNAALYPPVEGISVGDLGMVGKVVWLGRRV